MKTKILGGWAPARLLLTAVAFLGLGACDEGVTAPDPEWAASLDVERSLLQLESLGESFEIRARVFTVDGETIPGAPLVWTVEGEDVVEHLGESSFRSRQNGIATIRVRLDPAAAAVAGAPLEAAVRVVVKQRAVALELTPANGAGSGDATVRLGALGQTVQIDAQAVDALGHPAPETPAGITWTIGDPEVSRLEDGGALRAMADGTTVLRGRAGGLEGAVTVEVDATLELSACATVGAAAPAAGACADRTLTVQVGG